MFLSHWILIVCLHTAIWFQILLFSTQILLFNSKSIVSASLSCSICVTYWPPTRPSCQKKKCTCVNNSCIRSKISGDQGWPWLSRGWIVCELWRSQEVGVRQIIILPRRQEVQISWREDAGMRTMSQVEQPRRTGKKGCESQRSWGSICSSSVQSPNPSGTEISPIDAI